MEVKLKEVSRDELWKRALSSPEIEAREAFEQLSISAESAEVQKFAELFSCRTHWLDRVEVVEALGRIANSEAVEMLVEIVMTSRQRMVKYYAARNLIEVGEHAWTRAIPNPARPSDFWMSLIGYNRFLNDELSIDELKRIALEKSKWPGDHWAWMAELKQKPSLPRTESHDHEK